MFLASLSRPTSHSAQGQEVARVVEGRGSNQVEIERGDGERHLVLVPSKYHKVVFLKKGDFVIVEMEPTPERIEGKVVGSVVVPLLAHHMKHLRSVGKVPERFEEVVAPGKQRDLDDMMPPDSDDEDYEERMAACGNVNRRDLVCSSDDE